MQNESFDYLAEDYDEQFTYSSIGKAQRKIVWNYLKNSLLENTSLNILELNCGTGEDALFFAQNGHQVLATDSSTKMLGITQTKAIRNGLGHKFNTKKVDLEDDKDLFFSADFDLIFSNFGGLNCIDNSRFEQLFLRLDNFTKSGSNFIGVIMPDRCLWENFWYLIHLDKRIFRRQKGNYSLAKIGEDFIKVWYYTAMDIDLLIGAKWELKKVLPVGFFIPPSYLEGYFSKNLNKLKLLEKMELKIKEFSFLHRYSDHFLIHFQKR